MTEEYPPSYIMRIKGVDGIIFLAGLIILTFPAIKGFFPGAFDTTVHVTLGALICVCAVFRVLVAYGSAWLEVVLCALGVLSFCIPTFMHMHYNGTYSTIHMGLGAVIIVLSVVSGLMTFGYLKKMPAARA